MSHKPHHHVRALFVSLFVCQVLYELHCKPVPQNFHRLDIVMNLTTYCRPYQDTVDCNCKVPQGRDFSNLNLKAVVKYFRARFALECFPWQVCILCRTDWLDNPLCSQYLFAQQKKLAHPVKILAKDTFLCSTSLTNICFIHVFVLAFGRVGDLDNLLNGLSYLSIAMGLRFLIQLSTLNISACVSKKEVK